jgi:hypothetical protein
MPRFKTVVIDADQMIYAIGFAAKGDPISYALSTVKKQLAKIQEECDAEERILYVKGKGNFREDVATTHGYKANRAASPKPDHYQDIYEYLVDVQGAIQCDGLEADDFVSVELYKDFKAAGGVPEEATLILSSGDKDLRNTPGWHHNPRTGEVVWYSDIQSLRHFWYQMLAGDRADNIKGLPTLPPLLCKEYGISKRGVGEAGAKKLMSMTTGAEDAEEFVYKLYLEWGNMLGYDEQVVKDYILENAQLLWMIREMDSEGQPVMFEINEELYERARRDSGRADSECTDRAIGEWGTESGDQPDNGLRVAPLGDSKDGDGSE